MSAQQEAKRAAREAAFARRRAAHAARPAEPARHLIRVLGEHRGRPLAGYLPIRTEIDPRPAMTEAARHGPVGVPVIRGKGLPLVFSRWAPDCRLVPGPFGAAIPETEALIVPEVLIVPLVAFDRYGGRLGYGGGFYDRTLAGLRAEGPVLAIGFAYAAQEAEDLPRDATDEPLDMIVTEEGVMSF
ncbi:5-formyltetrahydrofolate cyclo-ligase [Rhodosalinus halophilus]|uniref:5-formyltetrahydrofolate cyclo-ligase n=1 Tax=Rhodosalinus halophilus TaxID=2259333 RepID=A0A365U8A8_9RHOB|nr:5-formyltetrahydrofolate cyclo-ligase [Rhodosalinus halophilus]RBI83879.1 5-formyltetrahydrofolate cyclo-ligase [Rhodosalinus halophilus]